ncbi:hypothetical protein [Tropicimonas sp. S265A]|uniref:hypothetical protein n=1 Tax=Tropicimonas sp. S265A TaxID=3415134 RepID=UPI003C7D4678
MTKFVGKIFNEPLLEFGDKHSHPDPKLGLSDAGPHQTYVGEVIKIGVVGSSKTIEDARAFMEAASDGFEGNTEKHPNLHPDFPGLKNQNPFRCGFEIGEHSTEALSKSQLDQVFKEPDHKKAVELAVDMICERLQVLEDSSERPDVAMVALPVRLIEGCGALRLKQNPPPRKKTAADQTPPTFAAS